MTIESFPPPLPGKKHPLTGIVSASISLAFFILNVFIFVSWFISHSNLENTWVNVLTFGCGILIALITGIVLAIVGLAQKNTKKVFSIIGIILNCLDLITIIVLTILSLLLSAAG